MTGDKPTVSVIILTHNRSTSLKRILDALGAQTYPLSQVEVVVVVDGCCDGTMAMLPGHEAPFAWQVIEQPGRGAATARNCGAASAQARLLLFLNDDVEPTPGLIEAHVRVHQRQSGQVVMGPYPPVFHEPADFFRIGLRNWWETRFQAMRQPGHRYTYCDLLGSNFSLEAELFACLKGFDPAFSGCGSENYEFGIRLIKAGASFVFAPDALAYHHETSNLDRSFQQARQEGRADVLIGRRHPELRPTLPLAQFETASWRASRLLRSLAFAWPALGDRVVTRLHRGLDLLEWARLRQRWRWLYRSLHAYWYWRGVIDELGANRRILASFLQGGLIHAHQDGPEIELNLRQGLEAAERQLDAERPMAVHIRYGQQPVGRIPPQPGAERLRGIHLRPILATDLAAPLLTALALEGALNKPIEGDWPLAAHTSNFQKLTLAGSHPKE